MGTLGRGRTFGGITDSSRAGRTRHGEAGRTPVLLVRARTGVEADQVWGGRTCVAPVCQHVNIVAAFLYQGTLHWVLSLRSLPRDRSGIFNVFSGEGPPEFSRITQLGTMISNGKSK